MTQYYYADKNEDNTWSVRMTDEFYKYVEPHFNNIPFKFLTFQLFNLLPQDFYHYVGVHYHAFFKKSDCLQTYVRMYFKSKADCTALCTELNARFQQAVDLKML